jgi:signal transduction histidine kinase
MRTRDIVVGVALTVALLLEATLSNQRDGSVAVNVVLYLPIGLLLLFQPLRPFELTLALIATMSLVSLAATDVVGMSTTLLVLLVAVWRAAMVLGDREAATCAIALLVAVPVVNVEHGSSSVGDYIFPTLVLAIVGFVARGLRHRALLARELALRTERLEVEREAQAASAVSDERRRIARELHDVVAHSVSVMVVQSGAARRVLDSDPDDAVAALTEVERSGRQALSELRRLLGLMRDGDESHAVREPQPTLRPRRPRQACPRRGPARRPAPGGRPLRAADGLRPRGLPRGAGIAHQRAETWRRRRPGDGAAALDR